MKLDIKIKSVAD